MPSCKICGIDFSRSDNLNRHMKNKHTTLDNNEPISQIKSSPAMTFQHPFSMVVSGPTGSEKKKKKKYGMDQRSAPFFSHWSFTRAYLVVLWPMATALRGVEKRNAKYHFYQMYSRSPKRRRVSRREEMQRHRLRRLDDRSQMWPRRRLFIYERLSSQKLSGHLSYSELISSR